MPPTMVSSRRQPHVGARSGKSARIQQGNRTRARLECKNLEKRIGDDIDGRDLVRSHVRDEDPEALPALCRMFGCYDTDLVDKAARRVYRDLPTFVPAKKKPTAKLSARNAQVISNN